MRAVSGFSDRVASLLAILTMVGAITPIARADEFRVLPPQLGSDPVVLQFTDGVSETTNPSELLQVFVGAADPDPCCEGRTPMAGRYAREGNTLAFSPAFGFEPGQDYLAQVGVGHEGPALVPFRVAVEAPTRAAAVTEIYPSGSMLPENVLRFYVHFSVPMAPHVAFDYIKLRDASGKVDEAAFMRFKRELWSEDRTRLTVLFDPGRIKRNVATNAELGPALLAGRDYTLSVDAGWPSADGTSALPQFTKQFTVTAPLRELPDVGQWRATAPCIGRREPLQIEFDRPFDRHLLVQNIRVTTEDGRDIVGAITVGEGERSWSFTPSAPWANASILIDVSPTLEDVAANNFQDLLDHVGSDMTMIGSTILPIDLNDCHN